MVALPHSEHEALADFVEALRKRSRALRHKVSRVECERVIERTDDIEHELIELRVYQRGHVGKEARLTCRLWDDRWCRFDTRKPSRSGWVFEWTYDGRLAGGNRGRDLVEAIEASYL